MEPNLSHLFHFLRDEADVHEESWSLPIDNIKTFEKHFLLLSDTTRTDYMILFSRAEQKYPNVCRCFILHLTNIFQAFFRSAPKSILFLKIPSQYKVVPLQKRLQFWTCSHTLSLGFRWKIKSVRDPHIGFGKLQVATSKRWRVGKGEHHFFL